MNDPQNNQGRQAGGQGGGSGAAGGAQNVNPHVINLQGAGGAGGGSAATGASDLQVKIDSYAIPEDMKQKYPELIALVVETESMTDDERQYWFQIMPVMTDEQLKKFQGILETEKKQLAKLDQEYEDQLKKLNDRHMIEWQEFEQREKRREIHEEETKAEAEEKKAEDDLLQQLEDL